MSVETPHSSVVDWMQLNLNANLQSSVKRKQVCVDEMTGKVQHTSPGRSLSFQWKIKLCLKYSVNFYFMFNMQRQVVIDL